MAYLFLIISVITSATSSIFGKMFNRKNDGCKDTSWFYNFYLTLILALAWGFLCLFDFSFDVGVLPYALLFSLCFTVCNIGIINALKYGPAALTALLVGLSLLVTTIWGFLFWDAKISVAVIIGLVFVVAAIVLCLYSKEKDDKSVSFKWLFYVCFAFFGNAGCSIVQRTQQVKFDGKHGNMLMFFAVSIAAVVFLFFYLKSDRSDTKVMLKNSWWIPICEGTSNLILNLMVMLMATTALSPSLIYPVISVGGLAIVTVFSLVVFKEKMHWWQWIGICVGAVAVVLLSF